MSRQTFVIVGASLAGAKAAEELRARGFDGRVALIGAERESPYERPPLSKDFLRGESEREKAYVHDAGFYEQNQIELISGSSATALNPSVRQISFGNRNTVRYDKCLLATGAAPRRLSVPGSELEGIYYLRTLSDSERLRERLEAGGRLAVVGAGWIGSEVAASARQRGLDVTLIDPLPLPNVRIFGPEIGSFYRDVHAQHGIDLALGHGVEGFEGDGQVMAVRVSGGRLIECDFAVVGVGVLPRTQLATDAGLNVDNGILVDAKLESSAADIFAAGDVANAWHPFYGRPVRVEHWANALNQGPAAARSMLGEPVSYDRIPYFFSDQYDVGMEYSGFAPQWDQVVLRGEPTDGEFVAFWLKDRRVVAGMNVNVWGLSEDIQALIRSGEQVDVRALRDPDSPLPELVAGLA
jgi:3-phenylpropionate/trans-cinnamate dioxygenase ferredoxin reductase component